MLNMGGEGNTLIFLKLINNTLEKLQLCYSNHLTTSHNELNEHGESEYCLQEGSLYHTPKPNPETGSVIRSE